VPGPPGGGPDAGSSGGPGAEELSETELLEIIPSLDAEAARRLRAHEVDGPARRRVLEALDRRLGTPGRAA
jgi:hypothetical protein